MKAGTTTTFAVYAILALAIIANIAVSLYLSGSTVDDAYILFRYSRNMASGYGIVWNPGEQPTQGMTSILWATMAAAAYILTPDAIAWMQLAGIFFNVLSILVVYLLATRIFKIKGITATLPPAAFSLTANSMFWNVLGLETPLFTFILLLTVYFTALSVQKKRINPLLGVLFFLLIITRPEGYVVLGTTILFVLYYIREGVLKTKDLKFLMPFLILFIPFIAWSWLYFGDPLPNPFYVKAFIWGNRFVKQSLYIVLFLVYSSPFIITAGLYLAKEKKLGIEKLYVLLTAILFIASYVFIYPAMGDYNRFLLPVLPLIMLFSFMAVRDLRYKPLLTLSAAFSIFLILFLVFYPMHTILDNKGTMGFYQCSQDSFETMAMWLDKLPKDTSIAITDMGYLGYRADVKTIDLSGLADNYLAHKGMDPDYIVNKKRPDIIFLNSFDADSFYIDPARTLYMIDAVLYQSGEFQNNYVYYTKFRGCLGNYYFAFVRNDSFNKLGLSPPVSP